MNIGSTACGTNKFTFINIFVRHSKWKGNKKIVTPLPLEIKMDK